MSDHDKLREQAERFLAYSAEVKQGRNVPAEGFARVVLELLDEIERLAESNRLGREPKGT